MLERFTIAVVFAVLVGAGSGCGSSAPSNVPREAPPKTGLEELGLVIRAASDQKQKPPAKLADLDKYEPIAQAGVTGVAQNKIVYLWGAGYKPGGTGIVAYETAAETNGGWVLLEDGSVKEMSASEFASAPKAGKK